MRHAVPRRVGIHHPVGQRLGASLAERTLARGGEGQHGAKRENIGGRSRLPAGDLLGRHEPRGA